MKPTPLIVVLVLITPVILVGQTAGPATSVGSVAAGRVKTKSGLVYEIVAKGTGPAARRGHEVRIHETLNDTNQPIARETPMCDHPI